MSIQDFSTTSRLNPLAGIKFPVRDGDAPIVTSPEAGPRDRLQLSLATQMALSAKAAEDSQSTVAEVKEAPQAPARKPLMNFPPYHASIFPLTAQRSAVETALGGTAATFEVGGVTTALSIARRPNTPEGHEQFDLTVGSSTFELTMAPQLDAKELLPRLVDAYSKVPEHLRASLKQVVLETATNPQDAFWEKAFGSSGFASGASAGGGKLTFWRLGEQTHNLSQSTFNHEMGHLIGELYSTGDATFAAHTPRGWKEAAQADGDVTSQYATNNPDEDFAETWSYYVYAKTDPEAMEVLRARFPHRLEILEAIDRNELERQPEQAASARRRARAV